MDLNAKYQARIDRRLPGGAPVASSADVPADATLATLIRNKSSHRGIRDRTGLHTLVAGAVDQSYLEEIACLDCLEHLEMLWPTTAIDLTPLTALKRLRVLKINSPRNICDFTPILALSSIAVLMIENPKNMASLNWLAPLSDRLNVLGIEGSMWTTHRIPTLAPLSGFALEALFLTNTRVADQDLTPLHTLPNLRYLGSASFIGSRESFKALHEARPGLVCDWFEDEPWEMLSGKSKF